MNNIEKAIPVAANLKWFITRSAMILPLLVLIIPFSCSRQNGPKVIPVTGQVKLDGKPLTKALVKFTPPNGRSSYGETDEDGKYSLRYSAQSLGAVLGVHRVEITTSAELQDSTPQLDTGGTVKAETPQTTFTPELLPKKYNVESTLTATVDSTNPNVCDFNLSRK